MTTEKSLLEQTLAAAQSDRRTVTDAGEPIRRLPEGMQIRASRNHHDDRGSVCEIFDERWNLQADPICFAYRFNIAPGVVKGWGLHQKHEDRNFLLSGKMKLVLYDVRHDSETYGEVSELVLSEDQPSLVSIPRNVWHADQNIGTTELMVLNFPYPSGLTALGEEIFR